MKLDPSQGGWLYAMKQATGRDRLAHRTSRLRRSAGMQPCAIGRGDRDPGRGVLRRTGRPPAAAEAAKSGQIIWDVDTMQDDC